MSFGSPFVLFLYFFCKTILATQIISTQAVIKCPAMVFENNTTRERGKYSAKYGFSREK